MKGRTFLHPLFSHSSWALHVDHKLLLSQWFTFLALVMAFASISSSLGGEFSLPALREQSSEHESQWWQIQTLKAKEWEALKRERDCLHLVSGYELLEFTLSSLSSQLWGQEVQVLCSIQIKWCYSSNLSMMLVSKSETKHSGAPCAACSWWALHSKISHPGTNVMHPSLTLVWAHQLLHRASAELSSSGLWVAAQPRACRFDCKYHPHGQFQLLVNSTMTVYYWIHISRAL